MLVDKKYSNADKKLVRDECCNYMQHSCLNTHPCHVMEGHMCPYYDNVVSQLKE